MTSPSLVQETNIERTLEDHLWNEIILLENKIVDLSTSIKYHEDRRDKLLDIAQAAGIERPAQQG